jgi:ABC-type branched-subunit amino acid transport system ATPase component
MSIFHTDSPISGTKENPDRLNRTTFAERIGEALKLRAESSPLVVSLEGPWGYGKTSVINLINQYYESLKPNERPVIFSFNPWMVGNAENLVQEFIVQFASAVGLSSKTKNAKEAAKQLLAYSKVFNVLKWLPGAEPWASVIEKVLSGVSSATEKIADLKDLNINQKRAAVVDALNKIKRPIVVFIDDLDRLPPNEVFQMIRAIKAITDFPRTTFLLAFERHYIENSLKLYGIDDSSSYLDKIIQVRLHLPLIAGDDLHLLAVSELQSLSEINITSFFEGDQSRLSEIYHLSVKPLIKTPRELKRVYNRLRFIEPSVRQNVCFSDTFALEVLAIKAPHVYKHLRSCPWAYNAQEPEHEFSLDKPDDILKKYEEERKKVLETVPKDERIYIKELIEKLFPLLDSGFSGGSRDMDYHYAKGHIASPDRLRFALTFGLPSGEISSNLISEFLNSTDNRERVANDLLAGDKTERFIELLLRTIKHNKPSKPDHFISCIAKIASSNSVKTLQEKPRDMLKSGPVRQLWWITEITLEKLQPDARSKILLGLSKHPEFICLSAFGLNFCLRQHGFYDEKDKVEKKLHWVNDSQLEIFKKQWVDSVVKIIAENAFFDVADPTHVLFMLRSIVPENAKDLVEPLLKNDDDLDSFAEAIGWGGQDSNKGEYSIVAEEVLDSFGGVNKIRERVKKRLASGVEDIALNAIYNSILTGEGYYLIDNTKTR